MNLSDSQTAGQGSPRRVSAMEAVLAHLRRLIERGEYPVGGKLPSEAALSRIGSSTATTARTGRKTALPRASMY